MTSILKNSSWQWTARWARFQAGESWWYKHTTPSFQPFEKRLWKWTSIQMTKIIAQHRSINHISFTTPERCIQWQNDFLKYHTDFTVQNDGPRNQVDCMNTWKLWASWLEKESDNSISTWVLWSLGSLYKLLLSLTRFEDTKKMDTIKRETLFLDCTASIGTEAVKLS